MYFNCKEAYCINGGQYEKAAESGSTTDNNAQIVEAADTGATLVFDQYDAEAPKGELSYGEDYVIEVLKDGKWEEAPITVEGD